MLSGDDTEGQTARDALTDATLASLARRRAPREQAVRHAEIRRLDLALREATRALKTNRTQLQAIVDDLAPAPDQPTRYRTGQRRPGNRQLLPPFDGADMTPPSPPWPAPAYSKPAAAAPSAGGGVSGVDGAGVSARYGASPRKLRERVYPAVRLSPTLVSVQPSALVLLDADTTCSPYEIRGSRAKSFTSKVN